MKAGVCTIALRDLPVDEAVRVIAESGAAAIELWGREPHLPPDRTGRRALLRAIRAAGLELCCLGSYYRPVDTNRADRKRGVPEERAERESAAAVLDAASDLEVPRVRIWPGDREPGACTSDQRREVVEEIQRFADAAEARGIAVVLERHAGTLTSGWDAPSGLLDEIDHPAVSLCYQVPYPVAAEELRVRSLDDFKSLLGRSTHAHLQNYIVAPDGSLPRTLLADGVVDYGAFGQVARDCGFKGCAMVEFIGPERGDRSELQALADDVGFIESL